MELERPDQARRDTVVIMGDDHMLDAVGVSHALGSLQPANDGTMTKGERRRGTTHDCNKSKSGIGVSSGEVRAPCTAPFAPSHSCHPVGLCWRSFQECGDDYDR